MRIAYVGLHLEEKIIKGGVGQKILSQMKIWGDLGHEARLFLLTPDDFTIQNVLTFHFGPPHGLRKVAARAGLEWNRSRALSALIKDLRAYHPDIIYLRYGLYAYPLQRLFNLAPVVVELNTLDVKEYRYRGAFFYWANRLTRGLTLRRSAGFIPVSHEIARANEHFHKPMRVIANGIDLSSIAPLPPPQNERPRLVFAGTPGYNWHGVDHLIGLARQYPDLCIEVVGYGLKDIPDQVPGNMILHGFIPHGEVKNILANADAAFGTLALYRKNMEEASPLKVREALAYGIPVILPYEDTDLSGCKCSFILDIPNKADNLQTHAEEVHQFAYRMRGKRVERPAIQPLIDQQEKESKRLAFFEQICTEAKERAR